LVDYLSDMKFALTCLAVLALSSACSEAANEPGPSGTGGSGSGGGSGATAPSSSKPQCKTMPSTGGVPTARADTAGVLTEDGRTLLMFGGDTAVVVCGDIPKREHVGDTWLLDTACGAWGQRSVTGPSPRARHVMVGDYARKRALLFGGRFRMGQSGNYTLYNDVWAFDFEMKAWSQLQTTGTPPSPRVNTAMVVDGDTLWLFGGNTTPAALTYQPQNDLYTLDLKTNEWRAVTAQGALPPKRLFHAMAVDPVAHRAYVAYGANENALLGPFYKDLFVLDLATTTWTKLDVAHPAGADVGRIKLGLSVRSGDGKEPARLLAVAGHDDAAPGLGNRNDVLTIDFDSKAAPGSLGALKWQAQIKGDTYNKPAKGQCDFPPDFVINDKMSVERRSAFAFAPLPSGEAFVIFAGDSDCGRLSDTWWYDTRAGRFEAISESLPGLTCPRTGNASCKSLCG
jgi:hypothetical protein